MNDILLEIKDLEIDYGIVKAVKGISMQVQKGTIVAILGANGAGKTSTIRSISGLTKAKSGKIFYNGQEIQNLPTYEIVKKGIMQSPEGRMILNDLTVEENLKIGGYAIKSAVVNGVKISRRKRLKSNIQEVFNYFPILAERRKQQASTLSGGEQQMLAIGRALMGSPDFLLLDEPSLGLAPLIIRDIFKIIQKIKEDGRTILIVEQNAKQTLKIADYVYLLEVGKVKTHGKSEEILNDDQLISTYLGGNV
jgi:branched-chain amino acid transport system ATP-binding protein